MPSGEGQNYLSKLLKLFVHAVWGGRVWPLVINWGQMEDPLPRFMSLVIKHNLFDFLLQVSYFLPCYERL